MVDKSKEGDAKFTWRFSGVQSHAEAISRQGRTVCGLKIGKKWARAKGQGHLGYLVKCAVCKAEVKRILRKRG